MPIEIQIQMVRLILLTLIKRKQVKSFPFALFDKAAYKINQHNQIKSRRYLL